MSFRINLITHLKCTMISILIGLIHKKFILASMQVFIMENLHFFDVKFPIINFYAFIIILMVPISVLHEFIHGIMYKFFGGKVKFGFKGIYAYTQEISGIPLTRTQFLIVLLLPVILISLLSAIIGGWLGSMVYILNLLGSSGDIYMSIILCKYNHTCKIIDRSYGFDIV